MARTKNSVETVQITLSTTEGVRDLLEQMTEGGLYGKNVADTANILITEKIRELIKNGELARPGQPAPGS